MKRITWLLLSVFAAVIFGLSPTYVLAGNSSRGAPDDSSENAGFAVLNATPQLPAGQVARYRVTYMKSNTATANRTSTVVSITNQSGATCSTGVDWRIGFGGTACTTSLTLGPGQTGEHCSRSIPSAVSSCNATCSPGLTFNEGSAIVGSSTTTGCSKIAVSARTYHTTGTDDSAVAAATDAKIVKIGAGNSGD